jgi:hypothetical protein
MMRTRALIAFAAVLVVALSIWATRGRVVKGGAPAVVEAGAEANCDSSSGAHMSEKCRAGVVTAAKSSAPQAAVPAAVVAPAIAPVVKLSPELHSKLNEIARLDRKAFLSDDEKAFRTNLLKDETFLREISRVLTSHELDQTTKREQYQAIDALLAAQEIGSPAASTLLAGVVSDAQVENETIAKDVRANLAGIKAEVLYKWTSQDNTARPESLLPGPVSRQLWSNVQETQSRNEAESRTLGR